MQAPEHKTKNYEVLINDITEGKIKIPQFQRDFVWPIQKSASLIDSVIKGYPIGTFTFWQTTETLRAVKSLGGQPLREPQAGVPVDYVLDGQQRLTSLYACFKGLRIRVIRNEKPKEEDFSNLYIDIEAEEGAQIVRTEREEHANQYRYIKVVDLLTKGITYLNQYPEKFHQKIDNYKDMIKSYQYPIVGIMNAPIDVATEIFTRINTSGKELSLFEIMVAKTYDDKPFGSEIHFDLSEEYKKLIDKLSKRGYETISDATVLQVIAIIIQGECKRRNILKIEKQKFIDSWKDAVDAIEEAVDYFRGYYRIPVSKLLPYNALIVPFAYFFFKHKDKPNVDMRDRLDDFFWRCSLSGRYSSGVEGKLAQDIKKIDKILKGELPSYGSPIDASEEFIKNNGGFSTGRSYIKAILCIYAYHQPKSFKNDSIVTIDNSWLKQANSKNYHHFFPKAWLEKQKEEHFYINHILNITIVDDYLNKREIGKKPPSKYMKKFERGNPNIKKTMETHLIGDFDSFGIVDDDYDKFFDERAKMVSKEIRKRIIPQEIDKKAQILGDDEEEDPTMAE